MQTSVGSNRIGRTIRSTYIEIFFVVEHQTCIHLWIGHLICTYRNKRTQRHQSFLKVNIVLSAYNIMAHVMVLHRTEVVVREIHLGRQQVWYGSTKTEITKLKVKSKVQVKLSCVQGTEKNWVQFVWHTNTRDIDIVVYIAGTQT